MGEARKSHIEGLQLACSAWCDSTCAHGCARFYVLHVEQWSKAGVPQTTHLHRGDPQSRCQNGALVSQVHNQYRTLYIHSLYQQQADASAAIHRPNCWPCKLPDRSQLQQNSVRCLCMTCYTWFAIITLNAAPQARATLAAEGGVDPAAGVEPEDFPSKGSCWGSAAS